MKFLVKFKCDGAYYYRQPVYKDNHEIGTSGVDKIRGELQLPDFPISRITGTTPEVLTAPAIEISEKEARQSGLFKETNYVAVTVPPQSLNRFLIPTVEKETTDTGEVISARLIYRLSESDVISAWIKDGYKTEWLQDSKDK